MTWPNWPHWMRTFLTIENNNPNNHIDPSIKRNRGQHLQFLRCFLDDLSQILQLPFWQVWGILVTKYKIEHLTELSHLMLHRLVSFDTLTATKTYYNTCYEHFWPVFAKTIWAMPFTFSVPKVVSLHLFGNGLTIKKCFWKEAQLGKFKVKIKQFVYIIIYCSLFLISRGDNNWLVHITRQSSELWLKKIYSEEKLNI